MKVVRLFLWPNFTLHYFLPTVFLIAIVLTDYGQLFGLLVPNNLIMKTNNKKEIVSVRMLLGLSVAFATSLCFLEYGKPYLGQHSSLGQAEIVDFIDIDDMPITRQDLPDPPKPVVQQTKVLIAAIDPTKITAEPIDLSDELPEFSFDTDDPVYFQTKNDPVVEPNLPFRIVEERPEFPGGDEALLKFLSKNVRYPGIMKDLGLSGIVYLEFVVGVDGNVEEESIKIDRTPNDAFSAEAIKAVRAMPTWKPGKQRGKPVRVYYNLPVHFKLR
jgi:periplasmic protein TonB